MGWALRSMSPRPCPAPPCGQQCHWRHRRQQGATDDERQAASGKQQAPSIERHACLTCTGPVLLLLRSLVHLHQGRGKTRGGCSEARGGFWRGVLLKARRARRQLAQCACSRLRRPSGPEAPVRPTFSGGGPSRSDGLPAASGTFEGNIGPLLTRWRASMRSLAGRTPVGPQSLPFRLLNLPAAADRFPSPG